MCSSSVDDEATIGPVCFDTSMKAGAILPRLFAITYGNPKFGTRIAGITAGIGITGLDGIGHGE